MYNQTCKANDMRIKPQTIEIDASNLGSIIIELDDSGAISKGLQAGRVDWELSYDNGVTWNPDGYATFCRGCIPQKSINHTIELRAKSLGQKNMVSTKWAVGTIFRFHWRQLEDIQVNLVSHKN